MASFKFKGSDLYTSASNKIAYIKGTEIFNARHNKVATIKGCDIINEATRSKVATVKGTDIYDEHGNKFATMNDVKKAIDGAMGGASIVGLWLFFVR